MPNEDPTLPPLGARTPRNIGRWLKATALVCLVLGVIIGAILL